MKVKLFDNLENKEVELEDSSLPNALKDDRYSVYPGQKFEFEDNTGQRKIVDSNDVFAAMDSGYKFIDSQAQQKEKAFQEAEEQPLLAAGIAGLSGVTLGASDYALKESGLFSSDELSNLREANPIVSGAAELAGNVAPIFLTGGTSILAKAAAATPAAIAERIGAKAAGSALAGKILSKTTSDVAKKAIQLGIGAGVEGSLVGAGKLLSEDALGDAEFNAENLLSYAGLGALTGGAVGGVIGGGSVISQNIFNAAKSKVQNLYSGLLKKEANEEIANVVSKKIEVENKLDDLVKKENIDLDSLQAQLDDDIIAQRASKLEKASQELGVPVTEGMKAGGIFAELEGSLAKSKSIGGALTSKEISKTYEGLEAIGQSFTKTAKKIDPVEIGTIGKEAVIAKIQDDLMPSKLLYEELKPIFKETPITESLKKRFITQRGEDFAARVAGDGQSWLKKVDNLESIDDVTKLRSLVREERAVSTGTQKEFLNNLYSNLTTLRENAIKFNTKGKPFVSKAGYRKDILENLNLADAMYRESNQKFEFLKKQFGIKADDLDSLMDSVQSLSDETIAKKILSLHDVSTAKKFQAAMPEVYDMARAARLSEIAESSMEKGKFSPVKFYKNVKDLNASQKEILFPNIKNPDSVIDNFKTIVDQLPPLTNPSGTAYELALQNMLNLPYQVSEFARYHALKNGSKAFNERLKKMASGEVGEVAADQAQKGIAEAAIQLPVLERIEKASNKSKVSISDAVDGYFKSSRDKRQIGIKGLERFITGRVLDEKEYKDAEEKALMFATEPGTVVENFQKKNKELFDSAPKTAVALGSKLAAATQFLAQKAPKINPSVFDDTRPSRSEVLKFKNYLDAVEKPYDAINAIAQGYITPEAIEAMEVVYPKMLQEIKTEFAGRIPEFKNLSEKQKGQLSRLLSLSDRAAYLPEGFARLQGQVNQATQEAITASRAPAQKNNFSKAGARDINSSNRTKSGLDRVLYRE